MAGVPAKYYATDAYRYNRGIFSTEYILISVCKFCALDLRSARISHATHPAGSEKVRVGGMGVVRGIMT